MKKPLIGVIPLHDIGRKSLWMLPGYFDGIRDAGGLPVMLPMTLPEEDLRDLCGRFDGFLLTGGQDVDPGLYHAQAERVCGEISPERDRMEKAVFDLAYEEDVPMLGICRGLQFMNVLMGGTLYQDLPSQYRGTPIVGHKMTPPYDRIVHTVEIVYGTPLFTLLNVGELGVNSYHHQAVRDLAPNLTPMAFAMDGIVEAAYCENRKFLWAVQWHPELNYRTEPTSTLIFREFIKHC